jgi:hypothetical protein
MTFACFIGLDWKYKLAYYFDLIGFTSKVDSRNSIIGFNLPVIKYIFRKIL